jgi:hypothetical protein
MPIPLSSAGPLARACRLFAALDLPITWHQPAAGSFALPEPPATVHVEVTAGSLLLVVLVEDRAASTAAAGDARLGPRDGDTAAVFTELALTPALAAADVRAALSALVSAVRRHGAPAAA